VSIDRPEDVSSTAQRPPVSGDEVVRPVEAAGGVVISTAPTAGDPLRVLIVHRPRYDDWSLPKGHLEAGELPLAAALREVLEETGVRAEAIAPLGTTEHRVAEAIKRVHWFLMRPATDLDDPAAGTPRLDDGEVDDARWCDVLEATRLLSYPSELALLQRALEVS
jgi:8-oxo-dGTP diphosphatase